MTKKGLYAGSFDPFTNGHKEIIESALQIFDQVVILLGTSSVKTPLFSRQLRLDMLKNHFNQQKNVQVVPWDGLTVEYARKHNITTIIRGLRPTGGFASEFQMASMNRSLDQKIETVFFIGKDNHFISSTLVREVFLHGGDIDPFVPSQVALLMKNHKAS